MLCELVRRINALEAQLRPLVYRHAAPLLAIPGVKVLTAARLIAEMADIDRLQHRRSARRARTVEQS